MLSVTGWLVRRAACPTFCAALMLGVPSAFAQNAAQPPAPPAKPADAAAPATEAPKGDPVVARVNGREIHMSDVQDAAQSVPEQMRNMPPQVLFPMLLDQMIDREALVLQAKKSGLDKDPAVQRDMVRAQQTRRCRTP